MKTEIGENLNRAAAWCCKNTGLAFEKYLKYPYFTRQSGVLLETAAKLSPEDDQIFECLGNFYYSTENSPEKAQSAYEKGAVLGNSNCQYALAVILESLPDENTNQERIHQLYRDAAAKGHPKAMTKAADLDRDDLSVPGDEILKRYLKAGKSGDPNAYLEAAFMFSREGRLPADDEKYMHYLKLAADQGCENALYTLGMEYLNGEKTAKDYKNAVHYLRKAAACLPWTRVDAEFELGKLYLQGLGCKQDPEEGIRLLEKAGRRDYPEANGILAEIFRDGKYGTEADADTAADYFQRGADLGDDYCLYGLGEAYKLGWGCPQNTAMAMECLQNAAGQGNSDAELMLAGIYLRGDGVPVNEWMALHVLEHGADHGNPRAMRLLGRLFLYGEQIPHNCKKGFYSLQNSANQGCKEAMYDLAVCYGSGMGTEKNLPQCLYWLRRANEEQESRAMHLMEGIAQDPRISNAEDEDAVRKLALACSDGAAFLLYHILRWNNETPSDREEAVNWCRLAANQGNRSAKAALGRRMMEEDHKQEGLQLLLSCVDPTNPDPEICAFLFSWYLTGEEPLPEVLRNSVDGIKRKAEAGDSCLYRAMGDYYGSEQSGEADPHLAMEWYLKAVKAGDVQAMESYADYLKNSDEDGTRNREAARWYEKALCEGSTGGLGDLILLYLGGCGLPVNGDRAEQLIAMLERSSRPTDRENAVIYRAFLLKNVRKDMQAAYDLLTEHQDLLLARKLLSQMYEEGCLGPKDPQKAKAIYEEEDSFDTDDKSGNVKSPADLFFGESGDVFTDPVQKEDSPSCMGEESDEPVQEGEPSDREKSFTPES